MNPIIMLAIGFVIMIMLSVPSSVLLIQNASALASVAQITSAKADGANLINGSFATIAQGKNMVKVTFEYRGFDDNDHVLELRCSWDGVNYVKRNCSTESAESRTTFTGPDGVARAYYVKTGTASRELAAPPVPKTYTFGVKVLNENGNLSPAATWTFKMRASTNPPMGGAQEGGGPALTENYFQKVKVRFDSITINNDHDRSPLLFKPSLCCSGEWKMYAYVQGKRILLFDESVDSGDTIYFKDKEVTVNLYSTRPLSVFTIGYEEDDVLEKSVGAEFCVDDNYSSQVTEILKGPSMSWTAKILDLQVSHEESCDKQNALGFITKIYPPPKYQAFPHSDTSSSGDFLLRYTISIEPINT